MYTLKLWSESIGKVKKQDFKGKPTTKLIKMYNSANKIKIVRDMTYISVKKCEFGVEYLWTGNILVTPIE